MIVRELVTRLGFQSDDRAARRHELSLRNVRRAAVALTAAYAATAGAALRLSQRLANTGNEIAKSATEAGMAADEFQRTSFALGQISRTTGPQAQRALTRLNMTIGQAKLEGGQYAEALQNIGFSQAEIESGSITANDALQQLTRRMGETATASEAAAIASDLLGRRVGRSIGPALRENAEQMLAAQQRAEELGGGWSEAALSASEEFVDTMGEVGMISSGVASTVAEVLLPAVRSVVDGFVEWWVANQDLVRQNVRRYVERLVTAMRAFFGIGRAVFRVVDSIVQQFGGWERALRLLTIAVSTLIGLRFARWLWAVQGALVAAVAGAGRLRWALLRIPGIAAFALLVVAIEDLITWIQGGESAIGRWLGSWEDFRETALEVIADIQDKMGPLIDLVQGFAEAMASGGLLPQAIRNLRDRWDDPDNPERVREQMSRSLPGAGAREARRQEINISAPATVNVPEGTPTEQRRSLERQTETLFREHWEREMRRALWNLQPVD